MKRYIIKLQITKKDTNRVFIRYVNIVTSSKKEAINKAIKRYSSKNTRVKSLNV